MMRAIEVDLDVYKALFQAKLSFDEPENDVLRRLLRITPLRVDLGHFAKVAEGAGERKHAEGGKQFRHGDRRLELPNGTRLRANYKGHTFEGEITDGDFLVSGKRFDSFSPALIAEVQRATGRKVSLNGWAYWQFLKPGNPRWRGVSADRS